MKLSDPKRQQYLLSWIQNLDSSTLDYSTKGRYICHVYHFLCNAETVNRTGYYHFMKSEYYETLGRRGRNEAILQFLSFIGKGFSRKNKIVLKEKKNLSPLEKIESTQRNKVNDFLYHLSLQRHYSEHTLRIYSFSLIDYFSYFSAFSQMNCRRYIDDLIAKKRAPQTIRLRVTSLEKYGEYIKKPVKLVHPKFTRKLSLENIPSTADVEKLTNYLLEKGKMDYYLILRVFVTTGCRMSEIMQMTFEMLASGSFQLKCKGNKYRQFFVTKDLKDYAKGKTGLIVRNKSDRAINTYLKGAAVKLGIRKEKIHAHAFRHYFAKQFLKKDKDVIKLADLLGHSNIDTTRIYLQRTHDEQQKDFNRVVTW